VAALERARTPPGSLALAPIASIHGDATAITIALSRPFAQLPALLAHSSTQVLGPASFDATGTITRIVGTGPYRVVDVHPPQSFDVVRFEGWDGRRPAVERARYLAVARSETRGLLAESGQADVVFGLDPATLVRFRTSGHPDLVAVTMPRTIVLLMNAGLPALSDVRTRRALSLAIDRPAIARAILRDPEMAATQLFPPTLRGWHAEGVPPLVTDVTAAGRLLQQAGWIRGRDHLLTRNGEPFHLELRTFPDRPELPILATVIQEEFRRLGIRVDVQIGNSGDIPLGHRDGSLQLGLSARTYTTVPDPVGTLLQDFGPNGGDWGAMNWANPELTRVLNDLTIVPESPQRVLLKRRAAEILQDELPVIPITWFRQTAAISDRVGGVTIDPLERSYRIAQITWVTGQPAAP
jgi:peptide/nickel transport system substrate-binding protein